MNGYTQRSLWIPLVFRTCVRRGENQVCCRQRTANKHDKCLSFVSTGNSRFLACRFHQYSYSSFPKCQFLNRTSSPCEISRSNSISSKVMDLKDVLGELNKFAPTSLAENWDNVGLLVEPTPPHQVRTMFLTNDLTEEVLKEAIDKKSNLILSYHPPIFVPLKRLTMAATKERIIVRAIEKRIAIYSPHTCYDAVAGGVNDWLAEGLGQCKVEPLKTSQQTSKNGWTHKVEYMETDSSPMLLPSALNTSASHLTKIQTVDGVQCTVNCNKQSLVSLFRNIEKLPEIRKTVQVTKLEKLPVPGTGAGRSCQLENPVAIATVVQRIKNHLGLQRVQLALGSQKSQESEVHTIAICAGSGASVLNGVPADVYLTGEMSHHDILAAVARGTSVILCNHSNTERGYLPVLKSKLDEVFDGKVEIVVSAVDADPLNVV